MSKELSNLLLLTLSVALVVALGLMGYTYATKDIVPKDSLKNKEINFDMLPPSTQDRYIPKTEHFSKVQELQRDKELLTNSLEDVKGEIKKQQELDKKEKKANQLLIQINSDKTPKSNFKTFTCKTFEKGSIVIPKSCKKSLYGFIDKYKETAKEFEVIGMVDQAEFVLISKLEDVYGSKEVKQVKKYVQIGLSRQRVIESTWLVKQRLKNNTDISSVNYTVYSNNKRGFVVRAYF